ncbi:UDP-GlcNAc:betaGal beta-1,3-N-acetylglucosaminyltransferase 7 [Brachyhypopomus gauderio]|uniref:UDP-GlcNAc:betaGal beta-1,3-N-acetylglucosaminyltransferase 7 n=1 Tax=Brachyhypopomus gauderio TaxID=698409 RepID=UPI0040421F18
MMTTRDRWRVMKTGGLMFLLAVVMLTVLQRGSARVGQIQVERHPRMEASAENNALNKPLYFRHKSFWKDTRKRLPATTEDPQVTLVRGPKSWDITASNCSANLNFSSLGWFTGLEENFQQFLLYRHCRLFPMTINHPEKCVGDVHLLMVIKSIITQYDRREVIRQTWGKEQVINGKRIKTIFLLGKSANEEEKANHQKLLEYEDYIYGDILQWDFMDSFFNLTLKETHFLKWFSTYCGDVPYIFKGDDDVFVSVENVLEFLESSKNIKHLFTGDVLVKARPIRRKENKYYVPQALYNKTYYPPYAGGGGFLMDGPLARKLYRVSETLDLFPIDDVFLGMCLEILQVTPIKHNAFKTFGLMKDKNSKLNKEPCFFKNMIVVHKLLPQDLKNMWRLVHTDLVCAQKMEPL